MTLIRLQKQQSLRKEPCFITTNVAKVIEEQARAAMWIEVTNKNIWEDYVEIKRSRIRDCIHHRRYPKELEQCCLGSMYRQ